MTRAAAAAWNQRGFVAPGQSTSTRAPAVAPAGNIEWTFFHSVLAALILCYVWRIQDLFSILGKLQMVSLVTLGAIGLFPLFGGLSRLGKLKPVSVFRIATGLLLLMVASVPTALWPGFSFRFILEDHIKTFLLMLLIAAGVSNRLQVKRLLWINFLGALTYSVVIMTRFQIQNGRLQGLIYYDSNDLGMLLAGTIPIGMYFVRSGESMFKRIISALGLGVLLLTVIKTGSRGGFLGLIAITIFMLARYSFFTRKAKAIAVTAGVCGMLSLSGDQYWEMMETMLHPTQDYNWSGNAESGRMEVWKRGMVYMGTHPLFGVGANAFFVAEGTISPLAKRQQFGRGLKWSAPHNSFVQIGAELGVFGLLGFLLLLRRSYQLCMGKKGVPRDPLGEAIAGSLIGFTVTSFFLTMAYSAFLYALLGIVIAYHLAAESEMQQGVAPVYQLRPRRRGGGWNQMQLQNEATGL